MERWGFDPEWSDAQALLAQLKWWRAGRPDGRERGPFNAWWSARCLVTCKERFEAGDKRAVMDALELCALDSLMMPMWLEAAYLEAYRKIVTYQAKGWDDVFGRAYPKSTNIAAENKRLRLAPEVFIRAAQLVQENPSRGIDAEFYEEVGKPLGLGKTLVQQYIADYSKRTGCNITDYRPAPLDSK